MALSVTWDTKVINVLQADLTLISGALYSMDTDQFRKDLNNLSDSEEGIVFDTTHEHTAEKTIAGDTFARFIEIINGYTVSFEDLQYTVKLIGSNNNIFDEGVIVHNQVSIIPTNSAGLINQATVELVRKLLDNRKELADGLSANLIVYDDDNTVLRTYNVTDEDNNAITLSAGDPAKQSKGV